MVGDDGLRTARPFSNASFPGIANTIHVGGTTGKSGHCRPATARPPADNFGHPHRDAADCFHRAVALDRTQEIHAAYALEAYTWTFLDRCDEASAQFHAHPVTPALKSEDFDAAAEACRKRLTEKTRRVKSAHANGEIGAGASTKR